MSTQSTQMTPSFRCFKDYDEPTQLEIEVLLQAAREQKVSWRQRRNCVLVAFWGFSSPDKCDTLVACLQRSFHTNKLFCKDVAVGRFEGVFLIPQTMLSTLTTLLESVNMSAGLVEILNVKRDASMCVHCVARHMQTTLLACMKRIEAGTNVRGRHPIFWGGAFEHLFTEMQINNTVQAITGLPFEANNMIMIFFSQQAEEQDARHARQRAETMRRQTSRIQSEAHRNDVIERENNRILFEVQRAYRSGTITAEAFHRIICGD